MFVVRATQKLLKRGAQPVLIPPPSTTALGDWYATVLVARPTHLVLAVSARSMLPVVVPAKNITALPERIAFGVQELLLTMGAPKALVERECAHMREAAFAKTENRRILGALNDFVFQLEHALFHHPELSLLGQSLRLAQTPTSVIEGAFPDKAALSLLQATHVLRKARGAV